MQKGFIERIEDDNVYVMLEDETIILLNRRQFRQDISIDMVVEIDGDNISVFPPSEELRKEIDKITKEIFVSFKDRKKK